MNPINQCIVVLALMSFAFWIVDSASFEDAYKVCEQEVDQVYKNNTVADIFTNCMEEQLQCGQVPGQQYTACPNRCEQSCIYYNAYLKNPSDENPAIPIFCMTRCPSPQCICEEGRYRQGDSCVLPQDCVSQSGRT